MKLGWFPIGHLLTPTLCHAAFPRYCTSVLKHINSDVLSISVAESVLYAPCHASKQSNMTHWLTGIIGYLHDVQCESKKVAPLKLFVVLSLPLNLYNWKLPWLLPKHIPMSSPILVHLSEYLCEIYHFCRCDSSDFEDWI